jgi:pimeloyl-ACP methyl ester carboxylesterase
MDMSTLARGRAHAALCRRSIDGGDGCELEYFVAGADGPPLICITALGQGLLVWSCLVEHFSNDRRVICWKPRGTHEAVERTHTLFDQVADLERIVEAERVSECQLVTWCSGAKVGVEFVRRRPIVSSLVMTNGTFKALPGLEHLETQFEQLMLELCKTVARQPMMARIMMNSMRSLLIGNPKSTTSTITYKGSGGAANSNPELKAMVVEPFQSEQSTINYSLQVVDYLSHDIGPSLAAVKIPMLLISGEFDQVSSPLMSKALSQRIPNASYREIPGGTHYCLYEKPEAVVRTLECFFDAPDVFHPLPESTEMVLG